MRSSKPDKKHWVSDSKTTHCAHAGCGKVFDRFGLSGVRRHHCRVCGRVFCGEHSAHRLRLNSSAQYDATGEPQRVCEGCFRAAQEPEKPASSLAHTALVLNTVAGAVTARDLTSAFKERRARHNSEQRERTQRVADAYGLLAQAVDPKQVVAWEADGHVKSCSVCARGFTQLLRRHHCRLCGSVVCERCSAHRKPAGVAVARASASDLNAPPPALPSVRACERCGELLERWERSEAVGAQRARAATSELATRYATLSEGAAATRSLLLEFHTQVGSFGGPRAVATLAEAQRTQQQLEAALPALMGLLKQFAAVTVDPGEAQVHELAKRAPAQLLKEALPRFHTLKRQLETKAKDKANARPSTEIWVPGQPSPPPPPPPPAEEARQGGGRRPYEGEAAQRTSELSDGGSPAPPPADPTLAEYLMAKRAFVDISRSSLLYADPKLDGLDEHLTARMAIPPEPGSVARRIPLMAELRAQALDTALRELRDELELWAPALELVWRTQEIEITEAIHAKRPAACETQGELLSYLLGVAVGACNVLDADVHPSHFVAARDALQELKEALKEIYTEVCIPY